MPIEFNAIETTRFGIRCARVIAPDAPLDQIDQAARDQDIRFLSIRVPTDAISRVQALEGDGFRLMDTLVYYHMAFRGDPPDPAPKSGLEIRAATPSDAEAVGTVAARAFAGYFGHFHADPRLSKADADAVYVEWATTSVLSPPADLPVLIAETGGRVAGFLATRKLDTGTGDITLNAVHPDSQGQGVYGCLLDHGLRLLQSAGCREALISTQINNIAVQKAWGKRGLRMHRSYYTLHKWLDDPGP